MSEANFRLRRPTPKSLQPNSDHLQPTSNGLQPTRSSLDAPQSPKPLCKALLSPTGVCYVSSWFGVCPPYSALLVPTFHFTDRADLGEDSTPLKHIAGALMTRKLTEWTITNSANYFSSGPFERFIMEWKGTDSNKKSATWPGHKLSINQARPQKEN